MPAYLATVEWDEGCVGDVYFVKHAIEARRAVCNHWQDGELGGATVRRMPHLDQYEATGDVPMIEMVYMGWWGECYNCDTKLTEDEQYDDDDNEFVMDVEKIVGTFGSAAFCCENCSDLYYGRQSVKRASKKTCYNAMKTYVEKRLGVSGISFSENPHADVWWENETAWVKKASIGFSVATDPAVHMHVEYKKSSRMADPEIYMTYPEKDWDILNPFFKERTGIVLDKTKSPD